MESPVRIKKGFNVVLVLFVVIEVNGYPSQGVSNEINNTTSLDQSSINSIKSISNETNIKFHPRNNTLLYQRNSNTILHPTAVRDYSNITIKNNTTSSEDTTHNYGSKITFRGSVKYFATRPPFKPKTNFIKRNLTKIDSEKLDEKLKQVNFKPISTLQSKFPIRRRNNTILKSSIRELNSKPSLDLSSETHIENLSEHVIDSKSLEHDNIDKPENEKSLNDAFNIDKYTSPEFHDINNVYSPSISPEIEHFIIPENVSDYFVNVGLAPYNHHQTNYSDHISDLTTPQTDLFDKRFKEVSESIRQNLADSEYSKETSPVKNPFVDLSPSTINFEKFLVRPQNNNTKLIFKNKKEIIFKDLKNAQSRHKDYLDSNDTKVFYETSALSTESYDQTFSTFKTIPLNNNINNNGFDVSTISSVSSNESTNTSINRDVIAIRRNDHIKSNITRKPFLSTIKMRTPTTAKPKIRILLKNNLVNVTAKDTLVTTLSPQLVKIHPFTRRRTINRILSTVSSKLDPVYQTDNSPTRVSDHTKYDTENSIPTLSKRGFMKYSEQSSNDTNTSNTIKDDQTPHLSLPPTATAWALITLKNTPLEKKNNSNNINERDSQSQEVVVKTGDDLQKLDKIPDIKLDSKPEYSKKQSMYEKLPTVFPMKNNSESQIFDDKDDDEYNDEETTVTITTKIEQTTIISENEQKLQNKTFNTDTYEFDEQSKAYEDTVQSSTTLNSEDDYSISDISLDDIKYSTQETDYNTIFTTTPTNNFFFKNMQEVKAQKENTYTLNSAETSTEHISTKSTLDKINEMSTLATTISLNTLKTNTEKEIDSKSKNEVNTKLTTNTPEIFTSIFETSIPISTHMSSDTSQSSSEMNTAIKTLQTFVNYKEDEPFLSTEYPYDEYNMSNDNLENDFMTTEDSNAKYFTTDDSKSTTFEMNTASSSFFHSSTNKVEFRTSFTTENPISITPSNLLTTRTSFAFDSEETKDLREGKENGITDNYDNTNNKLTTNQFNNLEDWIEAPELTTKQLNNNFSSNINSSQSAFDPEIPDNSTEFNAVTIHKSHNKPYDITTILYPNSNIEVIVPDVAELLPNGEHGTHHRTTPSYIDGLDGLEDKFESTIDGSGAIAAITISVIGVIALLLLVGLLIVIRGRRRSGGYGQRCTPVSLDSYSLDNVSVGGSQRRKIRGLSKRSYGNPAYDESGAASHPMQFAALTNFSLDQESMINEFNEIPVITVKSNEVPMGCESKNRYSNIIPLPETRVILKSIPGDETSDYINGNYVRGPKSMKNYYIACQAPLGSTVNDFWRMIWEQNSRVILMLTELMESGVEKCFEYIPPSEVSDSKRVFGNYQVIVKKREVREKYVISILQLKSLNTNTWREITHMWYFWPAKGVPDECHSIIAFLIEARSYLKASQTAKEYNEEGNDSVISNETTKHQKSNVIEQAENSNGENDIHVYNVQKGEHTIKNGSMKNGVLYDGTEERKRGGPLVVHCSPGTGRTGTLIACDIGIRDFEMTRTVDVPKTVYRIRRDRANAVQTKDQYIFIYKILAEYATKLTGGVLDSI